MSKLKNFVLWNQYKAECALNTSCDTLEKLLEAEDKSGYSYSSSVQLTEEQLEQVLTAIHNETDILLLSEELKTNK